MTKPRRLETGGSLIEVLVAILLLSLGMLSLGVTMSFAVQMPKLSGFRATAINLAANHIERIRANPGAFKSGAYSTPLRPLSYDGANGTIEPANCTYPNCTEVSLAEMDDASTKKAARAQLPYGGMLVTCDSTPCGDNAYGNLWIVWQEPSSRSALDPASSDNCPVEVTTTFIDPKPRCIYVRFRV
ncbi:MAG: type IV pilus modification protein PilV [Aeromicrobium sp.]|nr:type IV pilus modification protein PilV [Burkholderiales bacterium]